jgi:pilus assembly protein CpaB
VLEKILVLAVAQQVSRDDTQPKVVNAVTLEVSPDQAGSTWRAAWERCRWCCAIRWTWPTSTPAAPPSTLLGKAELPAPAPLAAPAPVTRTVVKTRTVAAAPRAGNCVGVLAGIRAAWSASDRKGETDEAPRRLDA